MVTLRNLLLLTVALLMSAASGCASLPAETQKRVDAIEGEIRKGILFTRDVAEMLEQAADAQRARSSEANESRMQLLRDVLKGYKRGLENYRLLQQYELTIQRFDDVSDWKKRLDVGARKLEEGTKAYLTDLRSMVKKLIAGTPATKLEEEKEAAEARRTVAEAYRESFTWLFSLLQAQQMGQ